MFTHNEYFSLVRFIGSWLDKIEAKEYEYPHQVYKVPVQTGFLDHFVMPALVEMPQPGFDPHHHVDHHAAEYVEAVETGDAEEITAKGDRAGMVHVQVG